MNIKIKNGRRTITNAIAYIAGFFDGEGCIRIKKSSQGGNSYYLWVAITNSNVIILKQIKDLFGGQIRKAEKTVNKTIYHYLITSSEAAEFLKTIDNFIIEKKTQATLALYFHHKKELLSPEEKKSIYVKMRELKKKDIHENPDLLTPDAKE